jgi:hypothetical protein
MPRRAPGIRFGAVTTPIELNPTRHRRSALRRGAGGLHRALAVAIVLAVFMQVYLIGAYIFGAGQGALDAHRSIGFTTHGLEVLLFVAALAAWLPRREFGLSALLAVIGTVQISLASGHRWVGGLHPLLALVVLAVAARLALRPRRQSAT